MNVYSSSNKKVSENDSRDLFALRRDLHALLFDHGKWVVALKGDQIVVRFINQSYEAAALYHNQMFDTTQLSHEFLFARSAWAIIEHAKSVVAGLRKRFHLTSESQVNEPQVESAQGSIGTDRKGRKRKAEDDAPLDSQVNEAQELREDLRLAEEFVVSSVLR